MCRLSNYIAQLLLVLSLKEIERLDAKMCAKFAEQTAQHKQEHQPIMDGVRRVDGRTEQMNQRIVRYIPPHTGEK